MYEIIVVKKNTTLGWVEQSGVKTEVGAKTLQRIYAREHFKEPEYDVFYRQENN